MDVHSFYLFSWTDVDDGTPAEWPFEDVAYDRGRAKELYENYFEQIEFSEAVGFDGVILNEHHFSAYAMDPSPPVLASHLAARTEELKLVFLGNVVPIRDNPIRLAEELAVIDTISGGRVVAGMARGIPMEYLAYNRADGPVGDGPDRSRDRFDEAIDLIVEAWTAEEPFDWNGEFWQYENVYIWPKPYQEPRPELWMPAGSEPSFRAAARHRMGVACAGPPAVIREGFDTYTRIAEEEFGWTPTREKFVMPRRVFVGETREEARDTARKHFEFFWEQLFGGVQRGTAAKSAGDDTYLPEKHYERLSEHVKRQMDFDFEEAVESGAITVGEPEHVVAEIERQYEAVGGAGHLALTVHHGDAPHETTMGNLELLGEEVLPELRSLD